MKKYTFAFALMCVALPLLAKNIQLTSPNGKLKVSIENDATATSFSITHDGTAVLNPSGLGMTTGSPPSIAATHELVVPKSMPMILAMLYLRGYKFKTIWE